jgi:UDP-N-acetylmuramyl pentapeptide phosphotransferase/UDP-N-acetylglucosamine-1-phosphate transferase
MMDRYVAAPLGAAAVSALAVSALLRARLMLDEPNERSLHAAPIPRTGGIAIVGGFAIAAILAHPDSGLLLLLMLAIALVSLLDDWRGLGAFPRLLTHIAVAAAFLHFGVGAASAIEWIALGLAVVWMINLYNFMDGSDGLAGGMAVIGFSAYALAATLAGYAVLASVSAAVAAAVLPFLVVNFHPARMFMGDAGSATLGFLAAALGIAGWNEGAWSFAFPILVFSPFIVDATATLGRRIATRQRFWQPHREHYYQKLVRMGLGHRRTAISEYVVMIASACVALASLGLHGSAVVGTLAIWLVLLTAAGVAIDRRWSRYLRKETPAWSR